MAQLARRESAEVALFTCTVVSERAPVARAQGLEVGSVGAPDFAHDDVAGPVTGGSAARGPGS